MSGARCPTTGFTRLGRKARQCAAEMGSGGLHAFGFFLCFGPLLPVPALWAGILGAVWLVASGGWIAWRAK
jgi:hypothetical protein